MLTNCSCTVHFTDWSTFWESHFTWGSN